MADIILEDIKLDLGLPDDYDAFDPTVQRHINSAFSRATQLGLGPPQGFKIQTGTETWQSFLGDAGDLEDVKAFIFLTVKLLFDPPATSFHIAAVEKQIEKLEWTLNVKREDEEWTEPTPR